MRTAEFEEFIFRIDFIASKSCHQNSSFSFLFKNSSDSRIINTIYIIHRVKLRKYTHFNKVSNSSNKVFKKIIQLRYFYQQ